MRTFLVVCCLCVFGLGTFTGCGDKPASAPAGGKVEKKTNDGKPAPGKTAKPHTTATK